MDKQSRILVLGKGLIGQRLYDRLKEIGYQNVLVTGHDTLDLTCQRDVNRYFEEHCLEYVFFCAVVTNTDLDNNPNFSATSTYGNVMMTCNVLEACKAYGVEKLLFLGSAALYPWNLPESHDPMDENLLEEFNLKGYRASMEPYALSKLVAMRMCQYYYAQYGCKFIYALPTHIYGNLSRKNLFFLERLVQDICRAENQKLGEIFVDVYGKGVAKKQFLHVDDCVEAMITIAEKYEDFYNPINICTSEVSNWADVVQRLCAITGYTGTVVFNSEKTENLANRICASSRLYALGWRPEISLDEGLRRLCGEYHATNSGRD